MLARVLIYGIASAITKNQRDSMSLRFLFVLPGWKGLNMIEISLKNIEKYYGANLILKDVSFDIKKGERIGLLGKNGAGKTTLFKIIAELEGFENGARMVRKGADIGVLDQIPQCPDGYTAYDVLYSAFNEIHALHERMQEIETDMSRNGDAKELLEKYGHLQHKFESLNGYAVEDNIKRICIGLKIDNRLAVTKFRELSGGEQTRVILGRLMLQKPDILLLDEPTNHLDLGSIEWLEDFLKTYKGTVVVISHDRYFLDRVVERIIEIVNGKAEIYEGSYSYYAKEKEERYLNRLESYEQQQKKVRQLEASAKRMHEWAKIADNPSMHKRAFSMEKRIEKMEKVEKPHSEKGIVSTFCEYGFSGKDVITAMSIVKSFEGRALIDRADFAVKKGERVAVLGNNGTGKSTLIKCITGEMKIESGSIKVGESIRSAYLPQVIAFERPQLTILDTIRDVMEISEGEARGLLAKYKFGKDDVNKLVESLSGGEKSRLRLCILMQKDVNLLLLDEPTNHLDIESREWLENALSEFEGTIVFISHDRYFINKFATRISQLFDGRITDFYGDYEYYKAKLQEQLKRSELPEKQKSGKALQSELKPAKSGVEDGKTRMMKLEGMIMELESQFASIDNDMQRYADDYGRLNQLYRQKTAVESQLQELYDEWVTLTS